MTTYEKTMAVITSCQTRQQLRTAHKYLLLATKKLNKKQSELLYINFRSMMFKLLSN